MEPQPIETAPRDGSRVLVWGKRGLPGRHRRRVTPSWYFVVWGYGCAWVNAETGMLVPEPTHWMPLSEPSATLRQGNDRR